MLDGRVGAIRAALDEDGFERTPIVAYSAKYASAFYGPFREVADSAPAFGDRRSYQLDPPNVREAIRECALDLDEGADAIMVKPALPYLDVIAAARARFDAPLFAYNVSGEYAMVKAAAAQGWLDERQAALESPDARSSGRAPTRSSPTGPQRSPPGSRAPSARGGVGDDRGRGGRGERPLGGGAPPGGRARGRRRCSRRSRPRRSRSGSRRSTRATSCTTAGRGSSRPTDRDTRILLGDYLYAHGLVRVAEAGDVRVVADLAALLSALRAAPRGGRAGRRRRRTASSGRRRSPASAGTTRSSRPPAPRCATGASRARSPTLAVTAAGAGRGRGRARPSRRAGGSRPLESAAMSTLLAVLDLVAQAEAPERAPTSRRKGNTSSSGC